MDACESGMRRHDLTSLWLNRFLSEGTTDDHRVELRKPLRHETVGIRVTTILEETKVELAVHVKHPSLKVQ